ncbi:MAG: 50S ribosomal protein L15 [Planctomycetia bacterium]|nr:MAG: 50S ribosomal protein L15 [Planctomycetia bacterium]
MTLHEITQAAGAHKRPKRVGRGEASGHGKTCTRGNKGCQSRAGGRIRITFIGGATPLYRKFPKRGFSNYNFRTEYEVINLSDLEAAFEAGAVVDRPALMDRGLIRGTSPVVKLLGGGALSRKLTVKVDAATDTARAAVEKAGGSLQVSPRRDSAALAKAKRNSAKRARAERAAKK